MLFRSVEYNGSTFVADDASILEIKADGTKKTHYIAGMPDYCCPQSLNVYDGKLYFTARHKDGTMDSEKVIKRVMSAPITDISAMTTLFTLEAESEFYEDRKDMLVAHGFIHIVTLSYNYQVFSMFGEKVSESHFDVKGSSHWNGAYDLGWVFGEDRIIHWNNKEDYVAQIPLYGAELKVPIIEVITHKEIVGDKFNKYSKYQAVGFINGELYLFIQDKDAVRPDDTGIYTYDVNTGLQKVFSGTENVYKASTIFTKDEMFVLYIWNNNRKIETRLWRMALDGSNSSDNITITTSSLYNLSYNNDLEPTDYSNICGDSIYIVVDKVVSTHSDDETRHWSTVLPVRKH